MDCQSSLQSTSSLVCLSESMGLFDCLDQGFGHARQRQVHMAQANVVQEGLFVSFAPHRPDSWRPVCLDVWKWDQVIPLSHLLLHVAQHQRHASQARENGIEIRFPRAWLVAALKPVQGRSILPFALSNMGRCTNWAPCSSAAGNQTCPMRP